MLRQLKSIGNILSADFLQAIILFLFCFPLFFQLSGSIFTAQDAVFKSHGSLLRVPLPIASVFCFIGIALFLRLGKSYFGMGFVFAFFMLMMLSAIVSTSGNEGAVDLARFIHLVQFVLPSFALVLGSLYRKPVSQYLGIEAIVLYVLMIVIPLEVVATISGGNTLSAHLYVFSLYQHFQYLPVIFLGFYFLAAASFYKKSYMRQLVLFLAPWMGIYIAQSISVTTMALALFGSSVFVWVLHKKRATRYALSLILLVLAAYLTLIPFVQDTMAYRAKFGQAKQSVSVEEVVSINKSDEPVEEGSIWDKLMQSLPKYLRDRGNYWHFYSVEIFENPRVFAFGHTSRPDRNKYPSAHNYYLDLVYNFGIVSLMPFIYLILVSIRTSGPAITKSKHPPDLVMLAALVVFFVFIDNFFKVGFSQPYPGMMMFFLWGVLHTRVFEYSNATPDNLAGEYDC